MVQVSGIPKRGFRALPHIGREETQNGVDGYLVPHHLVGKLGVGHLAGILV